LVVTAVLVVRIVAIDKPGVMILLIPPTAGAIVALWKPWHRWATVMACILTAVITLIGGVGLLYVPSIALYLWAFVRSFRNPRAPTPVMRP
jgi:hypothetical protein